MLITAIRDYVQSPTADPTKVYALMHSGISDESKEILWRDPVLRDWYRAHPAITEQPQPETEALTPPGQDATWAEWTIYTGQNYPGQPFHDWLYVQDNHP